MMDRMKKLLSTLCIITLLVSGTGMAFAEEVEAPVVAEESATVVETVVEEIPVAAEPAVVEEIPVQVVEETPVQEVAPAAVEETHAQEVAPAAVEETPAQEEAPAAVEETPDQEEASAVVEETPAQEETPTEVEETPAEVEETPASEVTETPSETEAPVADEKEQGSDAAIETESDAEAVPAEDEVDEIGDDFVFEDEEDELVIDDADAGYIDEELIDGMIPEVTDELKYPESQELKVGKYVDGYISDTEDAVIILNADATRTVTLTLYYNGAQVHAKVDGETIRLESAVDAYGQACFTYDLDVVAGTSYTITLSSANAAYRLHADEKQTEVQAEVTEAPAEETIETTEPAEEEAVVAEEETIETENEISEENTESESATPAQEEVEVETTEAVVADENTEIENNDNNNEETATEAEAEVTEEPAEERTEEPAAELTEEPTEETEVEATEVEVKEASEATEEPVEEATEEPVAELTEEPTEEPEVETTEVEVTEDPEATEEPAEETTEEPVAELTEETTEELEVETIEVEVTEAPEATEDLTEEPVEEPEAEATEEPASEPSEVPAADTAEDEETETNVEEEALTENADVENADEANEAESEKAEEEQTEEEENVVKAWVTINKEEYTIGEQIVLNANAVEELDNQIIWQTRAAESDEETDYVKAGYGLKLTVDVTEENAHNFYRFVNTVDGTISEEIQLEAAGAIVEEEHIITDEEMLEMGYYKVMVVLDIGTELYSNPDALGESIEHLDTGAELWIKPIDEMWAEVYSTNENDPAQYVSLVDLAAIKLPKSAVDFPIRKIMISSSLSGRGIITVNDEVTLTASLENFLEDDIYVCEWQYTPDDGLNFYPIEESNALTYTFNINEQNFRYGWRVVLSLQSKKQ